MILRRLRLFDFRVYHDVLLEPQAGLNLLLGPNGSGKTAILEALHLLSAARSFRASREYELCRWGESACLVEGHFETDSSHPRSLSLRWRRNGGEWKKEAQLQGDSVARLADFLECVPLSLFTPSDIELVKGSPSVRRRYLDLLLSKMSSLHLQELARLKKVLSSRNALLREGRPGRELAPWNKLLHQLSVSVGTRRDQAVERLNLVCANFFGRLTEKEQGIKLTYKRCWPEEWEAFQERLDELSEQERRRGTTLLSPQKDDLEISRHERSLRHYGSQGEQRIVALCLRLAEARRLAEEKNERAILLLDDAFGELDPQKKERLLSLLPEFSQVLVTSATPLGDLGTDFHRFQVEGGSVEALDR